jgi:predicted CXXCH cytochrome family protein
MRVILVTSPLVIALLIWGCSSGARERLTHFFFEVPAEPSAPAPADTGGETTRPASTVTATPAARFVSHHDPYRERKCASCHESTGRMQVRENYADSCKSCHPSYFTEAVGHSPVSDGDCALCHLPHQSENPALLRQPLYETCVDCHEPPAELSQPSHAGAGVRNCLQCHDAHFGQPPLLKKRVDDAGSLGLLRQLRPGLEAGPSTKSAGPFVRADQPKAPRNDP